MVKAGGEYENVDTESLYKTAGEDLYANKASRKHAEFMNKFYARAFIVVLYLFGGINHTKKLSQYLFSLNQGIPVDEAFKHAFKMTFAEFEKEVNI